MSSKPSAAVAEGRGGERRGQTHAGTAGEMLLFWPAAGLKAPASSFSSMVFSWEMILRLAMMSVKVVVSSVLAWWSI